ncbi:hypothetical protein [Kaistella palustris]|uniref:hypothetical protein n=1 Tax=Kaistella palustris TaxID=493376 RepID=UPI0012EC3069|nr:hypothetical protein [Kaistella palustris]
MESNILMDQSALGMMGMLGNNSGLLQSKELKNITTDWKSLYDIQKDGLVTLNSDSVQILKKMFMKVNKEKGEIYGLSIKYDKLLPSEVTDLFTQSKQLKSLPLQNMATWNGKMLTIDTDKFNNAEFLSEMAQPGKTETTAPKTKSDSLEVYGKQMAQGMLGMMKMFNMNFTNTLKFQKPIKSIVGKHDFVKQIDNRTVQINVRSKELLDGGKNLINKDKKIIITTE